MMFEKVPPLTCKKCGSFKVFVTDDGVVCENCDKEKDIRHVEITEEVEYEIYNLKKMNYRLDNG